VRESSCKASEQRENDVMASKAGKMWTARQWDSKVMVRSQGIKINRTIQHQSCGTVGLGNVRQ
jgi:hypothetical protein